MTALQAQPFARLADELRFVLITSAARRRAACRGPPGNGGGRRKSTACVIVATGLDGRKSARAAGTGATT
jgi:hypothetical protein